jgi:hypothetical protein
MGFFSRMTTSWSKSSRLQELQQKISPHDGDVVDDLLSDFRSSREGGLSAKTQALEEFFDLCESDAGVRNVMLVEHLSRSDLKRLHAKLLGAGLGWVKGHNVALSTIAYVEPLQYLVRAQKQEEGWAKICFNLLEYWEGRIPQGELLSLPSSAPLVKTVTSTTEKASAAVTSPNIRIEYSFSAPTISWGAPLSYPKPQNNLLKSGTPISVPQSKPKPMDCLTLPSGDRLTQSRMREARASLPPTRTTRSRTTPEPQEKEAQILPLLVRQFDENNNTHAFENKLSVSTANYVMPPLPPELADTEGIIPWNLVIDPKVGTESCLLLLDRTPFIHALAKVRPFDLQLKSGLVRTDHGPLFFLLFYVPDPNRPGEVFTAIDVHVNPYDQQHMSGWRDLARQTHWHLILLGVDDKLVDLFEFANTFGLSYTIDQVEAVCEKLPHGSFDEAKAEFCATYTLDDLMQLQ